MDSPEIIKVPRKIKLVLEDDGGDKFNFYAEGDLTRIGHVPESQYSPAEFWAVIFYGLCQEQLEQTKDVKKIVKPSIITPGGA